MKHISIWEKHQRIIARQTLNMPDELVPVMGGMTKKEAKKILTPNVKELSLPKIV